MAEHDADVRNEHEDEREDGEPNLNVEVAHVVTDISRASRCVNYLQDAVDALGAAAANTVSERAADAFQTALDYLTEMHVAAAADLASAMAVQERLVREHGQPEVEVPEEWVARTIEEPCNAIAKLEDGDALEDGEHCCDLPRGHHGPHHCYCRYEWSDPQPEPDPRPDRCSARRADTVGCVCHRPPDHQGEHRCGYCTAAWHDEEEHAALAGSCRSASFRDGTAHHCHLAPEHDGEHACRCGQLWVTLHSLLEPPIEERPECGERRPGVPHCRCGKPRGHEGPHTCRASACSRGGWEDDDLHSQQVDDACDQILADDKGVIHYCCNREPRHEGRHACRCGEVWGGWWVTPSEVRRDLPGA